LVAVLHLLCGLSMDRCSFAMVAIRSIIQLVVVASTPESSNLSPTTLSSKMPINIETVIERLDLHPLTLDFVCCPKCFKCYSIGSDDSYPERCTHKETPSSQPCNRQLRKATTI
ncbi:hypothetical protein BJ322DRAFT_993139, partial [Thelephora terrestris]